YLTYKNKKGSKDPEALIKYAESKKNFFKSKFIKNSIRFMPVLVLGINLFGFFSKNIFMIYIGLGILIVQILIWLLSMFRNSKILGTVHYIKYNLETYLEVLKLLKKENFCSEELKRIKGTMFPQGCSSIEAIKELDKITEIINIRSGGIANLILNILFLWDYQCIFLLEKWKMRYGDRVKDWIEGIGEIESLISFSVLNNINNHIVFPKIVDGKSRIVAEEIGHPLINMEDRVDNDIKIDDEIFIITGSNMSGKTTFLRTIGINLVLAYNGAGVCAKSMELTLLDLITSMRIVDDLRGGISTFYAEILRIKRIIDRAETQDNMIFLIDEIFTGTNSVDRILGAKNVIGNLNKDNIIGMITTHDLELCALDSRKRIRNFYFEDKYDDKTLRFDYKIKSGKSTSTNAKNLMNLAGIKIVEQ
ncbi:MutS-related protein, partial [Schnuerera sp.]|uniref:MutS-related protein n=1 Tax=Schnuerera sp. TaxID=2794844 RepID=UPI002C2818B3